MPPGRRRYLEGETVVGRRDGKGEGCGCWRGGEQRGMQAGESRKTEGIQMGRKERWRKEHKNMEMEGIMKNIG
ncbi:hypothetical protein E2C01_055891 [Portunus trituberculatus]|uniref:Uncharacterized protein n=1 Tax=Portunus trituberculatus TaxID=210409 RepID=A0A5B7GYV8_PORTR|nr:hypothetical protein [Portunus trituberculatus]